jgi:hypothetical protein
MTQVLIGSTYWVDDTGQMWFAQTFVDPSTGVTITTQTPVASN